MVTKWASAPPQRHARGIQQQRQAQAAEQDASERVVLKRELVAARWLTRRQRRWGVGRGSQRTLPALRLRASAPTSACTRLRPPCAAPRGWQELGPARCGGGRPHRPISLQLRGPAPSGDMFKLDTCLSSGRTNVCYQMNTCVSAKHSTAVAKGMFVETTQYLGPSKRALAQREPDPVAQARRPSTAQMLCLRLPPRSPQPPPPTCLSPGPPLPVRPLQPWMRPWRGAHCRRHGARQLHSGNGRTPCRHRPAFNQKASGRHLVVPPASIARGCRKPACSRPRTSSTPRSLRSAPEPFEPHGAGFAGRRGRR